MDCREIIEAVSQTRVTKKTTWVVMFSFFIMAMGLLFLSFLKNTIEWDIILLSLGVYITILLQWMSYQRRKISNETARDFVLFLKRIMAE